MYPIIILKPLIFIAIIINLIYYHLSQVLEKIGRQPAWVKELSRYYQVSPQKIIKQYRRKRLVAAKLWGKKKRSTEVKIHSFYQETDYFVYRQNYFNNHKAFFDIALPLCFKKRGCFCEYGAGVGPITNWLIKKFPHWHYTVVDLDCPVLKFARWRFKNKNNVDFKVVTPICLPLKKKFDIIVCREVLEHVSNPLAVVKHQVGHLKSGGWLYVDFINEPGGENLQASARQRKEVLRYLNQKLMPVFIINPNNPAKGYGLYIKC